MNHECPILHQAWMVLAGGSARADEIEDRKNANEGRAKNHRLRLIVP